MGAPKCDRVLACLVGQLLDEALDGEHVVVWADAAPEAGVDTRWLFPIELHAQVRDVVRDVLGRGDAIRIYTLLKNGGQKSSIHGRARSSVLPADDAVALQARPEEVAVGRSIEIVTHVFLAGPHHLDRSRDLFGDAC